MDGTAGCHIECDVCNPVRMRNYGAQEIDNRFLTRRLEGARARPTLAAAGSQALTAKIVDKTLATVWLLSNYLEESLVTVVTVREG